MTQRPKGGRFRPSKILSQTALAGEVRRLQSRGRRVVFTNGCFDLLHIGHVRYLQAARRLGEALAVAVNTDASVLRLKGPGRPLSPERERMTILAALECVDYVSLFGEETPLRLIRKVAPDILVKGGDWPVAQIVGREVVEKSGGLVLSIPLIPEVSTTALIRKIQALARPPSREKKK